MSFAEIAEIGAFLRKAIPILGQHFDSVAPYLDLEPVSHPDIVKIIQLYSSQDIFPWNDFIPTTGAALARRSDYREVLDAFKKVGVKGFEFTLHGNRRVHNEAVNNAQAFDLQLESLERIKQHGFLAQSNVIVSKKLIECFDEVCRILAAHAFDALRLTIPHFQPTERLRRFEEYRTELHEIAPIAAHTLFQTCTNSAFWSEYEGYTEKALLKKVAGFDSTWEEMVNQFPQWVFITVVPGLDVYYGNGALLHRRIGNLRTIDFCRLIEKITRLKSGSPGG